MSILEYFGDEIAGRAPQAETARSSA
jgi:hypothetical protein